MDENPYQAPIASGVAVERKKLPDWAQFLVGSVAFAPFSWMLGHGLIPPDEQADRLAVGVWLVLVVVWGAIVFARRSDVRPGHDRKSPESVNNR
jgi:hypothetical protein